MGAVSGQRPIGAASLFLSHLGVAREDLVFDLVDVAVNGSEQLLPAYAQRLHRVLSVTVLEYHALLYGLMDLFQLL